MITHISGDRQRLELDHLSLALLLSSQLEVLGSLDRDLVLPLALSALQPQDQLLGGLGLLPQDGLGLTSEPLLLAVVPTTTLGLLGLSGLLVLGHLEGLVGQALGVGAVRPAELGPVHHDGLTEYLRINLFSLLIPLVEVNQAIL